MKIQLQNSEDEIRNHNKNIPSIAINDISVTRSYGTYNLWGAFFSGGDVMYPWTGRPNRVS